MISVCLASHNGERYIKTQIDSILCQLSSIDEVVVSDDGSTDRTVEIIEGYNDPRLKIYRYNHSVHYSHTHSYVTHNFENAIKHAKGDIIFLSDQDDMWMPDKVEKCSAALQTCGLVVHNMRIADEGMNDSGENYYKHGFKRFRNYFMRAGKYYGCTIAFRKELLKYILPFPKRLILHDYWTGILAECFGGAKYIDKPLILYRMRNESVSHKVHNTFWFKISYRIYTLWNLYERIAKFKIRCK